jgi:RHS repeat-associated protein
LFEYNFRFPGQQYDSVVGLHYNYFRDLIRLLEGTQKSDPIGLKAGRNTYAYVKNRPAILSDPFGLLSMTVAAAWSVRSDLADGILGRTFSYIRNVRCTCECSGGEWRLTGCYAFFYIEAFLRTKYDSGKQAAFAHWGEGQHVQDYKNAAEKIRRHGEEEENAQRLQTFSSRAQCEKSTASAVEYALNGERIEAFQQT